ncbi:MAG: hypothetical protein IJ833_00420 [Lachnospiraceae bacterium]|nr:hypothetical protein [Lachnospiraceae bacterium]
MDTNNQSMGGSPLTSLPLGFTMALATNESAMQEYSRLTETEKEHLIMRCKDAKSKKEMEKIVDSLVPEGNIHNLYEHGEPATGQTGGQIY